MFHMPMVLWHIGRETVNGTMASSVRGSSQLVSICSVLYVQYLSTAFQ